MDNVNAEHQKDLTALPQQYLEAPKMIQTRNSYGNYLY